QHAPAWESHGRGGRRAGLAAGGDALAVLGHHAGPPFPVAAQALEHPLQVGRLTRVVTGQRDVAVGVPALPAPLGAEEDEVHLGAAGGDADPADAAPVAEAF